MKIPFYGMEVAKSGEIILSEVESRHCIKVLRNKISDKVNVLDGRGSLYNCSIIDDNFQECRLKVNHVDFKERKKYKLHLAVAPPKNQDRIDWLVEKSVEMGAYKLSFIFTERTVRKKNKIERCEKIAISAMKQSCSRYKLIIDEFKTFNDFIRSVNVAQKLIPHIEEGERDLIYNQLKPNQNTCVLIGPEGDFCPKEIDFARKYEFNPVSLGDRRLRTETAAIMTIASFNYINGY
jgi:16S rRNA (uracil1498-N3)-methyltransferase